MTEIWHYTVGRNKREHQNIAYSKKGDQINYRFEKK
jgi:hypothetical protein